MVNQVEMINSTSLKSFALKGKKEGRERRSQEFEIGELGERSRNGAGEVVLVQIQAHEALQPAKLFRYRAP